MRFGLQYILAFIPLIWANLAIGAGGDIVSVQTLEGSDLSCSFDHTQINSGQKQAYYICGSALLINSSERNWHFIRLGPDHTSVFETTSLVKGVDGKVLYAENDRSPADPDTETKRYMHDRFALNLLNGSLYPFKPALKSQIRAEGTPKYEKLYSALSFEAQSEMKKIESEFKDDELTAKLSDGKTTKCKRGKTQDLKPKTADPILGLVSSCPLPLGSCPAVTEDFGCELFTCSPLSINGQNHDVVMFQNASADEWAKPVVFISGVLSTQPNVSVETYSEGKQASSTPLSFAPASLSKVFNTDDFPTALKPQAAEISSALNPDLTSQIQYWKSRKGIDRFFSNRQKDLDEIAKTLAAVDVVTLVDFVNGAFSTKIVPKTSLSSGVCELQPRVYYSAELQNQLGVFNAKFGLSAEKPVSQIEAAKIFRQVLAMKDVPFGYVQDGCYDRAEVIADRLEKMGVSTQKVWIAGDLSPKAHPEVSWHYHVAVVIPVATSKNQITQMVIDPSLANEPVSVEKWASLISHQGPGPLTYVPFPPPDNAALFQRATVSFSPSSVYNLHTSDETLTPFDKDSYISHLQSALADNVKNLQLLEAAKNGTNE
jgi:hypothetical protein